MIRWPLDSVVLLAVFILVHATDGQTLQFPPAAPKVTVPFKIADNLIIVDASLNGKTGSFIFDTGAESTVVNASFAKTLGLTPKGTTVGNGSAGSATAGIIRGVKLSVGEISVTDLTVYSLPIDEFAPALGFNIAGIIGNEVIGKLVAEIDYTKSLLTLCDPAKFVVPSSAEKMDLLIEDGLPFVTAAIELDEHRSERLKMEIDTGSTGAILLNSPMVKKYKLLTTLTAYMDTKTGGVGGTGTSKISRIKGVRLGNFEIKEPIAQLYTGTKGDNASTRYDGLLGGAIFRRFKMTVDLLHKRLFLEPGDRLADPFDTDMSGMELVADGDDLRTISIDEVKPDSTAEKAGIKEGDVVLSIDGRRDTELGIQEARRLMRTAGTHDLVVIRNARQINIRLDLKRQI